MKPLFGEFMIRSGAVTPAQLAKALVAQLKELPTVCEVLYESGALTPEQILTCLNLQSAKGVDFVSACRESGYWTAEMQLQVEKAVALKRTPIGRVLIDQKALDHEKLVELLGQYLAIEDSSAIPAPAPLASQPISMNGDPLVLNYCEIYSDEAHVLLEQAFTQVHATGSMTAMDSTQATTVRQLQGASELAGVASESKFFGAIYQLWESRQRLGDINGLADVIQSGFKKTYSRRSNFLAGHAYEPDSELEQYSETLLKFGSSQTLGGS